MDAFSEALTSPFWWFSVVVVGIAVNLASAALKPRLDGLVLQLLEQYRYSKQGRAENRHTLLSALAGDDQERMFVALEAAWLQAEATKFVILAVGSFILDTIIRVPSTVWVVRNSLFIFGWVFLLAWLFVDYIAGRVHSTFLSAHLRKLDAVTAVPDAE